jgi:hypothetical protein
MVGIEVFAICLIVAAIIGAIIDALVAGDQQMPMQVQMDLPSFVNLVQSSQLNAFIGGKISVKDQGFQREGTTSRIELRGSDLMIGYSQVGFNVRLVLPDSKIKLRGGTLSINYMGLLVELSPNPQDELTRQNTVPVIIGA